MITKRLSKMLASCGVASRRNCEDLIQTGRVTVNGEVVTLPQYQVSALDVLHVDGTPIGDEEEKHYYILNKPKGYLSHTNHMGSHKLVLNLFNEISDRLFTVGRLDKDTTGLIVVTNDGDFANRVIHPSSNITKEYLVKTDEEITDQHLKMMSRGTTIEGVTVKPKKVQKIRRGTFKIVVSEGKKHEVRLLAQKAKLNILELKRIRLGGLLLGNLPEGRWKPLNNQERSAIFQSKSFYE